MRGRLLTFEAKAAQMNVAMEEAVFRLNPGATFRVWANERSVVIGRGQLARYETDMKYCAEHGIPVVRRLTAGGAVYHGPGNLNWSVFLVRSDVGPLHPGRLDPALAFELAGGLAVEALRRCGVECRQDALNRISNWEGKLSGMAAFVSREGVLCHGTLLRGADLEEARRLTTPVSVDAEKRYVRSRPVKMANCSVSREDFTRAFKEAAESNLGVSAEAEEPTAEETRLASSLVEQRYGRDDWNLGDPFVTPL